MISTKTPEEIRTARRRTRLDVGLIRIAALWPKDGMNLGTLIRTCDAIGAVLVVPDTAPAAKAVKRGNKIGDKHAPIERIRVDPIEWLASNRSERIVGVELAHGSYPISELSPAVSATIVVLGHEASGIPNEAWPHIGEAVEIPMRGIGTSLNVAVAGSLVAYKLAGLI